MELLPKFPEFAQLSIEHREVIEGYFKANKSAVSELNFAEMFAWHKVRDTKITEHNGNMCIFLDKNGKKLFYPPLGTNQPHETVKVMLNWAASQGYDASFYGFTANEAAELAKEGLESVEDGDNADYIYNSEDLIHLAGRKYDGKRNHLRKFKSEYEFEFRQVGTEMIPEVMEFQKKWCESRACDDDLSLQNESRAVMETLKHFGELSVVGAAILVNGHIQAFTVASELNEAAAVVLFEKANPEFRGIYQAINQLFCEKVLAGYKWINREQDAGDEGLRRAKLSYHPDHMERKFIVKLK